MSGKPKHFPIAFRVGNPKEPDVDYSTEDVAKWTEQIQWWVKESQPLEESPKDKAAAIMRAALNGTKINGEMWPGIQHFSLRSRIRQLCGWDIETGTGQSAARAMKQAKATAHPANRKAKANREATTAALNDLSSAEMLTRCKEFKELLIQQYPWLDSPIYEIQVNALAEAQVKLDSLSDQFLTSDNKALEQVLKVKELLRKDISDMMELLSIHPKQLKDRVDETDRGDVGSLIAKWEELGTIATEYETVDAIQELIQAVRSAHNRRVDGSPQLADYELWHRTGCAGCMHTCECGKTYELYRGFTLDELEAAAEQAYKTFGFGLKRKNLNGGVADGGREATTAPEV